MSHIMKPSQLTQDLDLTFTLLGGRSPLLKMYLDGSQNLGLGENKCVLLIFLLI